MAPRSHARVLNDSAPTHRPFEIAGSINALLDRLPRSHISIGGVFVPIYTACRLMGSLLGVAALVTLSALLDLDIWLALVIGGLASAVSMLLGWIRAKFLMRKERVLLEHLLAILLSWLAMLAALGVTPWPYMDAGIVAVAWYLACVRVGCTLVGCCHGRPAPVGICYPPECSDAPPGMRLVPVQIIEALLWLTLALIACVLALKGPPGQAAAVVPIVYGAARLFLEPLRGGMTTRVKGLPESVWLAPTAILTGLIVAWCAGNTAEPTTTQSGVSGLLMASLVSIAATVDALAASRRARSWRRADPALPAQLDALVPEIASLAHDHDHIVRTWSLQRYIIGASIGSDDSPPGLVLSVSGLQARPHTAEAHLVLGCLTRALGVSRVRSTARKARTAEGMFVWSGLPLPPARQAVGRHVVH